LGVGTIFWFEKIGKKLGITKKTYGQYKRTANMKDNDIIESSLDIFQNDFQLCLEKIKNINNNEILFKKMISEPFLKNNKIKNSIFDLELSMKQFSKVMKLQQSWLAEYTVDPEF
jgi:hypothetical protein